MREANRHWRATNRTRGFPSGVRRHRILLGAPEREEERRIGDLVCRAPLRPVPLWPRLRFEVPAGPDGRVWNEWSVRAPGDPGPVLRTPRDVVPWSCVVDEVARAFPPARPLEGDAPTRWRLAFAGGRVAHFTHGSVRFVTAPG